MLFAGVLLLECCCWRAVAGVLLLEYWRCCWCGGAVAGVVALVAGVVALVAGEAVDATASIATAPPHQLYLMTQINDFLITTHRGF